jgi:predicted RNA-binding protein associated with RNAse of E/G family
VVFDGRVVLMAGFGIVYFELIGKWFTIGKIRDLGGKHTGYYCDIATPPRRLDDGGVELTDLFLDLWVSPDLKYQVLDEDELERAVCKGWISNQLYKKAKQELKKLINLVEEGNFPPQSVKDLEAKLNL